MKQRIEKWKGLIINTMILQVATDPKIKDKQKTVELLKGSIGEIIAYNRMAKALGMNVDALHRKLNRERSKRVRKPAVIR